MKHTLEAARKSALWSFCRWALLAAAVGLCVGVVGVVFHKSQGVRVELSHKEFLLLYKLLSCPGKTFTRRQLMDEVWDMDTDSDEHTVNVHINRLRDKFGENRDFAIVTVRGLGYKAVRL